MDKRYTLLRKALDKSFSKLQLIDDPLLCTTYGTDASFYRLTPQLIVRICNESEVIELLRQASNHQTPVTFRAAGTSLSGQAVSDSVLAVLEGNHWLDYEILQQGAAIRLQPGIIGSQANHYLSPLGRKIGPDPASITSCKIGGIAANNASGMCCGIDQNSYKTVQSMRLIFADGSLLDTGSEESRKAFQSSHSALLDRLSELCNKIRLNAPLAERIRNKYKIKNTTGYSLNALVDYDDPFEILQHLMIGSEGTLGFISEITYRTVPEYRDKASALVLFPTVSTACHAVPRLKKLPVEAVEMMDRAALHSIEHNPGVDPAIQQLPDQATALLIETRAKDAVELQQKIQTIELALSAEETLGGIHFTDQPAEFEQLWKIRKGMFPSVGAMRASGTTVVIEDIAFPIDHLAEGTEALQELFQTHGYDDAIIFGHALEGNLHFVITPAFNIPAEVKRYHHFMDALSEMVVKRFDGSLKAEHSTGRNMAPYVELEWGPEAYQLMQEIKQLFDPTELLNPGVILNEDPTIHIKNLKPMPAVNPLIDRCIECGFCEPICPSRNLSLTPRQRIVIQRELKHQQLTGNQETTLPDNFKWMTLDTCAADGLCATLCPVGINTGEMVLQQRAEQFPARGHRIARLANDHFKTLTRATRFGLQAAHWVARLTGTTPVEWVSGALTKISRNRIPSWHRWMPRGASAIKPNDESTSHAAKAVYFSACVTQMMGSASSDQEQPQGLNQVIVSLFEKAGTTMITLPSDDAHCCGMPFNSKGAVEDADQRLRQLEETLWECSEQGKLPILCDTSPCTARMVDGFSRPMTLLEPVGFALKELVPRMERIEQIDKMTLFIPCSARKMGLKPDFLQLASLCAKEVFLPEEEGCCGFSGDKGFTIPELNAASLSRLKQQLPSGCEQGYSTSRTCEIGLSRHTQIHYRSILYLVDRCFR